MAQANDNAKAFCLNQLRDLNYDRYLACLYLPEEIRGFAIALYAFDAEIVKISRATSEPMTGEIRIQWWRDTLAAGILDNPTHNPLADNLLAELAAHKLPPLPLDTYLQARIFDLYHDPMPDLGTLEGYCGETASSLFQLLTMAAKFEQDRSIADICGHAGMVSALTDMLRALSRHTAENRLYFPLEMLREQGLEPKDWFAEDRGPDHQKIIGQLLDMAETHLNKLRILVGEYGDNNAQLSLILLPVALCQPYLRSVRSLNNQIFEQIPTLSPIKKHWDLWRSARSGKI